MNRLLCLRILLPKIFIFSAETEGEIYRSLAYPQELHWWPLTNEITWQKWQQQ